MKISLHKALEEKFGIGKMKTQKELDELINVLMQNPDQEIKFNVKSK